jgi:hypothetical protein
LKFLRHLLFLGFPGKPQAESRFHLGDFIDAPLVSPASELRRQPDLDNLAGQNIIRLGPAEH